MLRQRRIQSKVLVTFVFFIIIFVLVIPLKFSNKSDNFSLDNLKKCLGKDIDKNLEKCLDIYLPNTWGNRIEKVLDLLAKIAATGGLIGVFYQFKRDKDLVEADFVVRLNRSFITNEKISYIYEKLENSKNNYQQENPFGESDIIDMANYLSFFEPLWQLIDCELMDISMIDLLAYRFFLATNNCFMQEQLLCKPGKEEAWQNIYLLHREWRTYRHQNDLPIWQEEHELSKVPAYSRITNLGKND